MASPGRVFLCHNSDDKVLVKELALALLQLGAVRTWLDEWGTTGGDRWESHIRKEFSASASCLVIVGAAGLGQFQKQEILWANERRALDASFKVIPVLLPGASADQQALMQQAIPGTHWVALGPDWNTLAGLSGLLAAIRGHRPGPPVRAISLAVAAENWDGGGRRDKSLLYRGRALAEARSLATRRGALDELSQEFLAASNDAARRRSTIGTTILTAIILVLTGTVWWANTQRKEADQARGEETKAREREAKQRTEAERQRDAAQAAQQAEFKAKEDAEAQRKLAVQERDFATEARKQAETQRTRATANALTARANQLGSMADAAYARGDLELALRLARAGLQISESSPVAERVATTALTSLQAKFVIQHRKGEDTRGSRSWLCARCDLAATSQDDGRLRVWDTRDGSLRSDLVLGDIGNVVAARFNSDGTVLAAASHLGYVNVWTLSSDGKDLGLKRQTRISSPIGVFDSLIDGKGFLETAATRLPQGDSALGEYPHADDPPRQDRAARFSSPGSPLFRIDSLEVSSAGDLVLARFATGALVLWRWRTDARAQPLNIRPQQSAQFLRGSGNVVGIRSGPELTHWSNSAKEPTSTEVTGLRAPFQLATEGSKASNGRLVVWGGRREVLVWDTKEEAKVWLLDGHRRAVTSAAIDDSGTRAITSSEDGTARLWNPWLKTSLTEYKGHFGPVRFADLSDDYRRVITAGDDRTVRIWDAESGRQLAELTGHTDAVTEARLSKDKGRIVSTSRDGTIRVWSTERESFGDEFTPSSSALLAGPTPSEDGTKILFRSNDHLRVWDVPTRRELFSITNPHMGLSRQVWFGWAGSAIYSIDSVSARLWTASDGRLLSECKAEGPVSAGAIALDSKSVVLAVHPNASAIKVPHTDSFAGGTAKVWMQHCSGPPTAKSVIPLTSVIRLRRDGVDALTVEYPGKLIRRRVSDWSGVHLFPAAIGTRSVEISPDGRYAASLSDSRDIEIWSIDTGTRLQLLRVPKGRVRHVSFSRSGDQLVASSDDGSARVWRLPKGSAVAEMTSYRGAVYQAAFSPDESLVVTIADDNIARIWNAKTGALLTELVGHRGRVSGATFVENGKTIVTASVDGTIRFWDAPHAASRTTPADLIRSIEQRLSPLGQMGWSKEECDLYFPIESIGRPIECDMRPRPRGR